MIRGLLTIALLSMAAYARTPNGTLGALQQPNNARPAMLGAGESFTAAAQAAGELRLVGETAEYPLPAEWKDAPGGGVRATIEVPSGAPAGLYALEWTRGDEADRNVRAVYVIPQPAAQDPFSRQYTFACLTMTRENTEETKPDTLAAAINAAQTQFAVVFFGGSEDDCRYVQSLLDQCTVPTVVIADVPQSVCTRWFGATTFGFRYGPDAFIAPASGRFGLADDLGPIAGDLQELLQEYKKARLVIGLFSRADAGVSMRNEITLFVDDSLRACIFGATGGMTPERPAVWAGWFDPPRVYGAPANRVEVFAANRNSLSMQKR